MSAMAAAFRVISYNKMSQEQGGNKNVSQFNKFLNNNTEFLAEKYLQYYGEPFPLSQLTTPQLIEVSLKFIYHIFSFRKYENDPQLNATLRSSLTENIEAFAKDTARQLGNPHVSYTNQLAVKLLKYCIENNDMFAVHYDKKNPPPQKQPPTQEAERVEQKQQPIEQRKQEEKQEEVSVERDEKQVKHEPVRETVKPKEEQSKEESLRDEMTSSNEFSCPPEGEVRENGQLIKKQLKDIFEFYCKQQQNVVPGCTFDNINHKCQTMNIGKFMAFAHAANIVYAPRQSYSEAKIDKNTLISAYKRAAQGEREIDLKKFMTIMEELKKADPKIYSMMGLGEDGVKGREKFVEKLKYLNFPFSTRDPQGREVSPHGRTFVPKLTGHSGMHEQALREQLAIRKERARLLSEDKPKTENRNKNSIRSTVQEDVSNFTLKLGRPSDDKEDLNFLAKLISKEDNDEIFLKDYKLPARNHVNEKQRDRNISAFEDGRYLKQEGTQTGDVRIDRKAGGFTGRISQKQQLVLPLIKQRAPAQTSTDRPSLGLAAKRSRQFN